MTARQRVLAIRLMEKMEKSDNVTKESDGTLKYKNEKNDVLFEAKMKRS